MPTTTLIQHPSLGPGSIALALALMLVGGPTVRAQSPSAAEQAAALDTELQLAIRAGPLGDSLAAWSRQTGITLTVRGSLPATRLAPAVEGRTTPRQALGRLLAGSGWVVAVEAGAVSVVPEAGHAATLPAVTVSARAASFSEGSSAFVVGATSSATGLDLSPRETPQSFSVITQQRMDDQAMQTVQQALQATTGVSIKPVDGGRNQLSARGFDITNFQFDGVPAASGNVGIETSSTAIYDRIEVVRGATGLVNGVGDPSASVNLIRKHADSRVFTGSASADVASWNQYDATVDLTAPISADGSVRARIVAAGGARDSFTDLEHRKYTVLYGVLDADLGPSTRLSLGASDQRTERSGVLWAGLPYWYSDGTRTNWPRSKTTAATWNQWDTTEQSAFATLAHTLGNGWTLRADVNWNRQNDDELLLWMWGDPDRATGLGMEAWPYHYVGTPEQTQINASASGPFTALGRRHQAFIAASWGRLKDGWLNQDPLAVPPVGDFNTWDGSYPEPVFGPVYTGSSTTVRQAAIYGSTQLRIADPLALILGGRLSNYVRQEDVGAWTPAAYEIRHDGIFVPYAGVVYDLAQQLSAYASYTDIYKPQDARNRDGQYLAPLTGKNYEIGLKGEFLGGRLQATGAVFRIEQENYAIPDAGHFVPGTTDPAYLPGRGVVSTGYELEVSGQIMPGWNLTAGWTQFRAKDANGMEVAVDHPRKEFKFFTAYTLPGAWNGLTVGGGVDWQGAAPAKVINPGTGVEETVGQSAYALVNLMARYAINPQVALQLNIDNLLDQTFIYSNWWGGPFIYGEPRRVMATLDFRF